jgi:hypothetical protein
VDSDVLDEKRLNNIRKHTPRGEAVKAAKLKEVDIPIIRKRLNDGEHTSVIAKDYGVAPQTINGIKFNRTWRHVK